MMVWDDLTSVQEVIEMMMRMRREMSGSAASEPHIMPQIDNLLIIDRVVDPLTPLLTQLTYEGLIDEFFTINNSQYYILASVIVVLCR